MEIIENLRTIYFPEDYTKIESSCRESYYYLDSLTIILQSTVSINKPTYLENAKKLFSQSSILSNQFLELDRVYKSHDSNIFELKDLWNRLKYYIELKTKIDQLQIEILELLFDINEEITEKISHKYIETENIRLQQIQDYHISMAFNKSHKSDLLENYRFFLKISDNANVIIHKIPGRLKIRNYNFELEQSRSLYKKSRKNQLQILSAITELEHRDTIDKLTKSQYELNKTIKQLTYISVFIASFALLKDEIYDSINWIISYFECLL